MSNINFFQGQNDLLSEFESGDSFDRSALNSIKEKLNELFNLKNIHFLIGSGTSCPAIPNMKGLAEKVDEKVEWISKAERVIKEEYLHIKKRVKDSSNLEDILGILYSHKIYLDNSKVFDKIRICDRLIEAMESEIFNNINVSEKDAHYNQTLNVYQNFYRRLALRNKDLSRLNIFTTNNDLFNETALDSLNINYINGFGGGLNKFFNPAFFNYTFSKRMDTSIGKFEPVENMVYLYKIHGSINWIEDNQNSNTYFKIKEINNPDRKNNNVLIYPTPTKQNKSLGSPYVELFREFQRKLLEPHSVLFVIGYSFSDEHINNVIYQALATNSTISVVVLNDIEDKAITKIEDNRIYRIYGEVEREESSGKKYSQPIHYFNFIVDELLPNIDTTKAEDSLTEFIQFYHKNLSK
ncbi:SIR2 family protein [Saccharicrinis sp. GN24d3]|uniref:SIR2 family protein n=1 Tax=Saccharicrinis sp. GN24d3 TaxID=3458416 RepID=UPI004035449F